MYRSSGRILEGACWGPFRLTALSVAVKASGPAWDIHIQADAPNWGACAQ